MLTWVSEGQKVLYYSPQRKRDILCVVECAAGLHARVTNSLYQIRTWVEVTTLKPYKESPYE